MQLIRPEDVGYDRLRAVFDHRVDRRPEAIARCSSREDVAESLALGLPYSVRSGAMGASDGDLLIDVSPLRDITIDVARREARVGGGVTWAELDAAAQAHGLAVTGGRISWMGVAGVALGEGSGWLERALGSTGDSVAEVEWVGGVATSLTLRLAPIEPTMLCGFLGFPSARAFEVARAYRGVMADAPPDVGGAFTVFAGRAGGCQVAFCFTGPMRAAEDWLRPLRALGPSLDAVAANEYVAFQTMTDDQHPFGMRADRRVAQLDSPSDDALAALLEAAARPTASALSRVVLRPRGGVLDGPPWTAECLGLWPPVPSLDDANVAWVDGVEAALRVASPTCSNTSP